MAIKFPLRDVSFWQNCNAMGLRRGLAIALFDISAGNKVIKIFGKVFFIRNRKANVFLADLQPVDRLYLSI